MSIESATSFIEKMKTDEGFSKQVLDCKDAEERNTVVKAAGFDFTVEEIKEISSNLSDEDLNLVAGGGCQSMICRSFHIST